MFFTILSITSPELTCRRQYVPPRAAWNNSPRVPSPLNVPSRAAELPGSKADDETAKDKPSSTYYEDVDPQFAETTPRTVQPPQPPALQAAKSYEEMRTGPGGRSPDAESEKSNFTSISQRGVNPRWNTPPMPAPGYGQQVPRRPVQQRQDLLLNSNPDFQLPGNRGASPAGRGGGMVPGSAYPTGL